MSTSCHPTWVDYWRKSWSPPRIVTVRIVWAGSVERRHCTQLRRCYGWFHRALADWQVRGASTLHNARSHALPCFDGAGACFQEAVSICPSPRCTAALWLRRCWFRATQLATVGRTVCSPRAGLLVCAQHVGTHKVFPCRESALWWRAWWRWARQRTQALAVGVLSVVVTGRATNCAPCGQQPGQVTWRAIRHIEQPAATHLVRTTSTAGRSR